MLIVITSENHLANENDALNLLFCNGLETLHLRKPDWTIDAYRKWIREIDSIHHSKLVLHHHHELSEEFNLKGVHLTEGTRKSLTDSASQYIQSMHHRQLTVSSSFHDRNDVEECALDLDYHFLSPVFDSISKKDYTGKMFDVSASRKKIIALGGIQSENVAEVNSLGFKGVAALGCIWNSENPVQAFQQLNQAYQSVPW